MKILIGSPSYDGNVRKEWMKSVLLLTDFFRSKGIEWELMLESSTLLHVMRSVMASKVLTSQEFTHLLFIDTDMAFNPSAVQKMIDSQLDVIGCAYPYRTIPLHEKPASAELSYRESLSKSVPYAVNFPAGTKTIDIKNGICKVDSVGTGLMLISRQALHTLVAESKVKEFSVGFPYNQWYSQARYHGFFEHLEIDGVYFSEDYSFCYRWRALCQREIWAVVDEEIMHIGPMPVLGRYVEKLSSGKL